MRDTAEAISRDTDVPVDWIRDSIGQLIRHDGLTRDEAYLEVRRAYAATFHAHVHRGTVAISQVVRAAWGRTRRLRSAWGSR
jgi:hypothetical protein